MTRGRSVMGAMVVSLALPALAAARQTQAAKPVAQLPRAEAQERNLRAYVELLRSDVRTQKIALITELMQFTEDEDAAFWPIYREYEQELRLLNDERLRVFETYSKVFTELTDETANNLMLKVLDTESRRAALKQKYYARLKTALSPLTSARALQIENQLEVLIDLQVAAMLPIVEETR